MSTRDRLLTILLGSFIALAVVGLIGYVLVWSPMEDKTTELDQLKKDVTDKTNKKDAIEKGNLRFRLLKMSSLPPEPNTAMREYNYVLTHLLNDAGVQAGSRTINVKLPTDKTTTPLVNPGAPAKEKKYAYQKVTADITMSKIRLDQLMRFLTSYQQLALLQHVTKLSVKAGENEFGGGSLAGRGGRGGGGAGGNRSDLTVILTSEALILDGIEPRESIVKIPRGVAALGGEAVYYLLDSNPEVARSLLLNKKLNLLQTDSSNRDYPAMSARDPFHGPLPQQVILGPYKAPVKPSVAEYIRMSSWTTNSSGIGQVDITDIAKNITYQINLDRKGEKLHTVVSKQRMANGAVQPFTIAMVGDTSVYSWVDKPFVISDAPVGKPESATSSTQRTITIHGLTQLGLIISQSGEDESHAAAAPFGGGRGGGRGGRGGGGGFPVTKPSISATGIEMANMAVAGTVLGQTDKKYYIWSVGQSLAELKEVPKTQVDDLLKNALAPLMPESTPVASSASDGR